MTKDAAVRLKETIQFIGRHHPPDFVGNTVLVQALNTWRQGASPATWKALSQLMSQEKAPHRPNNKTDRSYRRACILVKCALELQQGQWGNEAARVNNGYRNYFADFYNDQMGSTRDALYSARGLAGQNLQLLKTQTKRLLQQYKLRVNGMPQAQVFTYSFYMSNGVYWLDCILPPNGRTTVNAINVPATPYVNVQNGLGNIQPTLSSIDDNCDLMLTTQFTGCCYCFAVNGGDLAAAHIDPQGHTTGFTGQYIAQQLRDNGGFSNGNGGVFHAYGRVAAGSNDPGGYPQAAHQMIIVAVKRNGGWRVYAQTDMGTHFTAERIG